MYYSILDIDTNNITYTGRNSKTKDEAIRALAELLYDAGDIETVDDFREEDANRCNFEIIEHEEPESED